MLRGVGGNLLGSPSPKGRTRARQLAAVPDLRGFRADHSRIDDVVLVRLRDARARALTAPRAAVRVRRFHGPATSAALHGQLLLDGDALHRVRHRDRVPVSARGHPPPARVVRLPRVPLLHRDPRRRLRLRLAKGCARLAIEDGKTLRDYGLQSERLLWPTKGPGVFEQEVAALEQAVGLTTLEKAVAWAQTKSMWPGTFGLACCAIEMMSIVSSRYDIARFGMEAFRSSPRQADLLIVSGRVAHKMAEPLRQIYDQMLEPKWVIAMGACASSGGMFNNYTILQGVDRIVPVDIYVPFCPPRPEALMEGIIRLHEAHQAGVPPAYDRKLAAAQ